MKEKATKQYAILTHLARAGVITKKQISRMTGSKSPNGQIRTLRDEGWPIATLVYGANGTRETAWMMTNE